jgi:translocation and assembly module TamB
VALSANAPIGLGSFDIHAAGDIVIYKDPEQPVSVTGSFDSLAGRFVFQGRRFELYPSSSVDFRGDFRNPELFITVYREVSGVETRVTISGPLRQPELRLSSNPPLDPSDVLSLIVFNTTTNELSASQQQELTVRAGALAVGFLANALTAALERSIGIDILEIEPATGPQGGAKVTVGEEIAPGLVARFSRNFGADEYDEATIEYYISRLLRLRATFSDASSVSLRRPFRRVETVGIDLLVFFSF